MHGTAAPLIDVIGTGDKLHNTAGALALVEAKSDRDAFVVKRLREAGVIILGKASLTGGRVLSPLTKCRATARCRGRRITRITKKPMCGDRAAVRRWRLHAQTD